MLIPTNGEDGKNGYLIPLWNEAEDPENRPAQVYATAVYAGARKGPHLHMKRRGAFHCVYGAVTVRLRDADGDYTDYFLMAGYPPVVVPVGFAAAIYNDSAEPAVLINMPDRAWTREDPDDHEVKNWTDPERWPNAEA